MESLAEIGGREGRPGSKNWQAHGSPAGVRVLAVAASPEAGCERGRDPCRRADPAGGRTRASISSRSWRPSSISRGLAAILAAAIEKHKIPADSAKLTLRAVYSIGLADPPLVEALGRAAGNLDRCQAADPRRAQHLDRRGRHQG